MSKFRKKVTEKEVHFKPKVRFWDSEKNKFGWVRMIDIRPHLIIEMDGKCYDASLYGIMFPIKEKFDEIEGKELKV